MRRINQLLRFCFIHLWQMNIQGRFDTETVRDWANANLAFNPRIFRHRNLVAASHKLHSAEEPR